MVGQSCDVVVVGAGLAGLACARHLTAAGLQTLVLEASDDIGGRVRSDHVDGFVLDRGFQVINTAYPEIRKMVDVEALNPRRFDRAFVIHRDGKQVRLADPRREPLAALRLLQHVGSLSDAAALAAWATYAAVAPASSLLGRTDISAREAWRQHGLSVRTIETVLMPFFAGLLLENEMTTSRRFTDLMMRMFVRGESVIPAAGMASLPQQLATGLDVRTETEVITVGPDRVHTVDEEIRAAAVIVASDAAAAARLLPLKDPVSWRGVTTFYHCTKEAPSQSPTLITDADRSPVTNSVVMTAAAPEYSSDDRSLIATSTVHDAARSKPSESAVRERLAILYATDTSSWELVERYELPRALPAMLAPNPMTRATRVADVYVCGDHRDTSSIQGALHSGRRIAAAVLSDLGTTPATQSGEAS